MSIIGIGLNLLLACLLAAALALGWRLNRRLKALRDSHDGFAAALYSHFLNLWWLVLVFCLYFLNADLQGL